MFAFYIYEFTPFYTIRTATTVSQNMMVMMTVTSYLVLLAEYETRDTASNLPFLLGRLFNGAID